jgi:hypothetical protein
LAWGLPKDLFPASGDSFLESEEIPYPIKHLAKAGLYTAQAYRELVRAITVLWGNLEKMEVS